MNHRLRTDRAYNLHLVNKADCDQFGWGLPQLDAVDVHPDDLIGWNYARHSSDSDAGVHFFVDDYQFEAVWREPERYTDRLKHFECVCTPDFSLYRDMPLPMQLWNVYRSRALGRFWQSIGIQVVPTLQWSTSESYDFAFAGIPMHSTVAVSSLGVLNDPLATMLWRAGVAEASRRIEPTRILFYGKSVDFDTDAEVVMYQNHVLERMAS